MVDVNVKESNGGYTALIFATYHNNVEFVKLLLANDKIDVDAEATDGYTALTIAEEKDFTECIDILLKK
jgi:ankyrin repeat protein